MFEYCPSCGRKDILPAGPKKLFCRSCSFTYFHNVAAAVVVILELDGKVLLLRRGKEPGKGKLDLPGGFVDPQENAEEALRREVREELGLELGTLAYFGSYPNTYEYKGVVYKTCDLFFSSKIDTLPIEPDKTEVEEIILANPLEIPDEEIAFESSKRCLRQFSRNTSLTMRP